MATFTDASGQSWRVEFDGFLLDRIAQEAKVDLAEVSGMLAVERDVKALIRVLVVTCEDQFKPLGKSAIEFQKQIRKEAITTAKQAVMEGLADFFPESEWSAMLSDLTTRKSQPEMTAEQLQLAAGFLRMDPEVQKDVMRLVRDEIDGRGNSQSLPDTESVAGLEDTQSIPAYDSQENVQPAPEAILSNNSG